MINPKWSAGAYSFIKQTFFAPWPFYDAGCSKHRQYWWFCCGYVCTRLTILLSLRWWTGWLIIAFSWLLFLYFLVIVFIKRTFFVPLLFFGAGCSKHQQHWWFCCGYVCKRLIVFLSLHLWIGWLIIALSWLLFLHFLVIVFIKWTFFVLLLFFDAGYSKHRLQWFFCCGAGLHP